MASLGKQWDSWPFSHTLFCEGKWQKKMLVGFHVAHILFGEGGRRKLCRFYYVMGKFWQANEFWCKRVWKDTKLKSTLDKKCKKYNDAEWRLCVDDKKRCSHRITTDLKHFLHSSNYCTIAFAAEYSMSYRVPPSNGPLMRTILWHNGTLFFCRRLINRSSIHMRDFIIGYKL